MEICEKMYQNLEILFESNEPKSIETSIKNKELNDEQKNRITVEIVLRMCYIHKHKFMH